MRSTGNHISDGNYDDHIIRSESMAKNEKDYCRYCGEIVYSSQVRKIPTTDQIICYNCCKESTIESIAEWTSTKEELSRFVKGILQLQSMAWW